MGTTITLLLIIKDTAILGHVGDSRCYFLRNRREFTQMSEDQTYVGYLLRTGQINQEEALTHPKRHVLMNALGVYPSASVDVKSFPYMGETVLLCSDGLYNNVPTNDIASVLKGEDTVEQKVDELIAIGNKNGGSDNIAVVIWEAQE
jgi:protein phosphatase